MKYRLNVVSDIHCKEDRLGFGKYLDTLRTMFTDKGFKTPFCIGIFGKWGSGKASFMHLLEERLLEDTAEPHAIPVWFNPWRYEKEEHLIIPLPISSIGNLSVKQAMKCLIRKVMIINPIVGIERNGHIPKVWKITRSCWYPMTMPSLSAGGDPEKRA